MQGMLQPFQLPLRAAPAAFRNSATLQKADLTKFLADFSLLPKQTNSYFRE